MQAALEPLFAGRTSLAVAQRLSIILAADKIFVLEKGRLVEQGNRSELLAGGGLHAHLYETQFGRAAQKESAGSELTQLGYVGGWGGLRPPHPPTPPLCLRRFYEYYLENWSSS